MELVSWGKTEWKVDSGTDDTVYSASKELEQNQVDLVGVELMFGDGGIVQETVGWSRIYEGVDVSGQKEVRGKDNHEGIQIVKSGCI